MFLPKFTAILSVYLAAVEVNLPKFDVVKSKTELKLYDFSFTIVNLS